MKTNKHLLKRLTSIQETLVTQHQNFGSLDEARQGWQSKLFVADFLNKVFPGPCRFSTGSIMDCDGNVAPGVDIAVELPMSPSFPMSDPSQDRLLMAESVAMVIEVRSDLSNQLAEVGTKASQVHRLQRRLVPRTPAHRTPRATIPVIAVGYHGYNNGEHLRRHLDAISKPYRPEAILLLEPGLFEGFGMSARGAVSLYALCIAINRMLRELNAADPNLVAYVHTPDEETETD